MGWRLETGNGRGDISLPNITKCGMVMVHVKEEAVAGQNISKEIDGVGAERVIKLLHSTVSNHLLSTNK